MSAPKRKVGAVLATVMAAGSLGLVGGTPASAHFSESRISLAADDKRAQGDEKILFFGKLKNRHLKCRKGEEVELVRRKTGVVDVDVTDAEGEFSFKHDPQPNRGRFFARYRGKGRFGYGDKHKCSRAISDPVRIRRQRG